MLSYAGKGRHWHYLVCNSRVGGRSAGLLGSERCQFWLAQLLLRVREEADLQNTAAKQQHKTPLTVPRCAAQATLQARKST